MTDTGRTSNPTPAVGVVRVDGLPVGTVTGIDLGAGDDFTAIERRIVGLNADHFILDELPLLRSPLTVVIRSFELKGRMPGQLWSIWQARNLSHRHTAGARKRKAALKQAARTRRVAIASS